MENNEAMAVENSFEDLNREELVSQMTDECANDSYEPVPVSEDEGGANLGVIGGVVALGAAAVTGGIVLYKKVKSGAVKEWIEDKKAHRALEKEKRQVMKKIRMADTKDQLEQISNKVNELVPEIVKEVPVVEAEVVSEPNKSHKKAK